MKNQNTLQVLDGLSLIPSIDVNTYRNPFFNLHDYVPNVRS